jgi:hypothetical protein
MTGPRWQDVLGQSATTFVGVATFPKLAYRLRWPTRLGPRGLLAYIAFNTLFLFLLRQFVLPGLERMAREEERAKEELTQRLRREPTDRELFEHRGITRER